MIGLIILIAVLAVLGFLLAWIVGIVAHEEISVMRGVGIIVCAGVANYAANLAIESASPDLATYTSLPVSFIILILMIKLIAEVEWKPAAIIALIYTVLLFVVGLVLAAMFS